MTIAVGADLEDIRKRGRETQLLVGVVFGFAVATLAADLVVAPLLNLLRGEAPAVIATVVRDNFIAALPTVFLVSGLWSAQRVFGRVGKGDVFTASNAAGVGEIGVAMTWCGIAEVVLVPTIRSWVTRAGGFDFNLEGWAVVLAALGGAVILFGRIWALAVEIKTEADQII